MNILHIILLLAGCIFYVQSQAAITRRFTYGVDTFYVPMNGQTLSALPYNAIDGATYEITPSGPNVIVNKNGRLEMKSNTSSSTPYRVVMKYKTRTDETSFTVNFRADAILGEVVSYLQVGYFESYQFVKDVPLTLPNYLNGVPTSCTVSPPLPAGMSYDNNGLSGSPLDTNDNIETYTFQCRNSVSETNKVEFKTKVHASLRPGILLSLFRSTGPERLSCSYAAPMNAFHTKNIRIEVQKIVDNVGRQYSGTAISWDSQTDLVNDWGATWTGFINVPQTGKYRFGTETDDGNWIFIDGQMIMDVSGCRAYQPRVDTDEIELTQGFHYLVINYFQSGGPNALILYWKKPSDTNFVVIPNNVYYYAPKFVFEYKQLYASYNRGVTNIRIEPVSIGIEPPTSYTVTPSLQTIGLSIDAQNGEITGSVPAATADGDGEDVEYVVTGTSAGQSFSVTLYIDVKNPNVPTHVYYNWAHGIYYIVNFEQGMTCFPGNYIDWRVRYIGDITKTICNNIDDLFYYKIEGTQQTIWVDNRNCGVGVLGFWKYIDTLWNDTTIPIKAVGANGQETTYNMVWRSIDVCPEGYVRLEVFGFGYTQQSLVGFIFSVYDVGNKLVFGASVKADGFDSRLGQCVVPGTYTVTGTYDNDDITDRPRLEVWVEKVYYTTIYGQAKTFSGSFVVGSVYCESTGDGFLRVPIGSLSTQLCPTGQIGERIKQCAFVRNLPGWHNIINTCRDVVAPTKLTYKTDKVTVFLGQSYRFTPEFDGDITLFSVTPPFAEATYSINNVTGVITITAPRAATTTYTIVGSTIVAGVSRAVSAILQIVATAGSGTANNLIGLRFGYNNYFQLVSDVPIYIPFYFESGSTTLCTINPTITGLTIINNALIGKISSNSSRVQDYTISCTNTHSTATAKISTKIETLFAPGLVASYGKLKSGSMNCATEYNPYSISNTVIGFVRIEDNINYRSDYSFVNWKGLNSDYREQFYAYYRFYLKTDVSGGYDFELHAEKGARLYIDHELSIDNGGCHGYISGKYSIALGVTYTLIEVMYWNTNGGNGLQLMWKTPNDAADVKPYVIPAANIFHVPDFKVTYKYQKASYIVNTEIDPNTPILYGVQSTAFTISPALPVGLTFETNTGRIHGRPTVHTNGTLINYYITASLNDGTTATAKVTFDIVDYQPPFDFSIRHTGATHSVSSTDLMIFPGNSISLSISASGNVNRYTIVPALPDGFNFKESTGLFTGKCGEPFETTFSVGAINSGGLSETSFKLTCSDRCPDNYEPIGIEIANNNALRHDYTVNFKVADKTLTIYKPDLSTDSFYSTCFLGGNQMEITGVNMNLYPITMKIYLLTQLHETRYSPVGGGEFSTPFVTTVPLSFATPSISLTITDYTVNTGQLVSITPIVIGVYTIAEVSPTLPAGVTLNTRTMEISGVPKFRTQRRQYTITVGTTSGKNTQSFYLAVTDCESTSTYSLNVQFVATVPASGHSYAIKQGSNNVIGDTINAIGTSVQSACVSSLTGLTLTLTSPNNFNWGTNYYVQVSLGEIDLGKFGITSNSFTQTISFPTITYAVNPIGTWEHGDSYPGDRWNTNNFTSSMMTSKLYSITSFSSTTKYLRYEIIKTSLNNVGMSLKFRHYSGAILYLNGVEVYRRNMPTGSVTQDTPASGVLSSLSEINLILPISLFNSNNKNILAMEFHRRDSSETFDLSVSAYYLLADECYDLTPLGSIISYSGQDDEYNPVTNALDGDPSTSWIELSSLTAGASPYIEFTFGTNNYYWFDTFGVMSSLDAMSYKSRNPRSIEIDATDLSGLTTTYRTEVSVVADNQPITSKIYDTYKLYNRIRFTIRDRVNPVSDSSIADVLVQSCRKMYCSATGRYPATMMDSTANVSCSDGYIGYELRYCRNTYNPRFNSPDTSNCKAGPPTNLEFESPQYAFYKNVEITDVVKPNVVSIGDISFTIEPSLPAGLRMNGYSGQITGTPTERTDNILYTVTAKNNRGSTSTQVYISVVAIVCRLQGYWPDTERNTNAEIDCVGGSIGKRKRLCNNYDPPSWENPDESTCRVGRAPGSATRGEVQLKYEITMTSIATSVEINSLFFDYFRIELAKLVSHLDAHTIIIVPGEFVTTLSLNAEDRIQLKQFHPSYKFNLYLSAVSESVEDMNTTFSSLFNVPYVFSTNLGSVLGSPALFIRQVYIEKYDYIPDETNNTLIIVLSVVFGVLFAAIVGICVWVRCKNRKSTSKKGSVKLQSNKAGRNSGGRSSGSSGGSNRSVRTTEGPKSARSVRL